VSAYRDGEKIVVLMPGWTTKADEKRFVADLVERITRRELKLEQVGSRADDSGLLERARDLSRLHLESRADPVSIRWVTNMEKRWGSCTTVDGSIRLSHRLKPMPDWVVDYVLVHELSHLLESGHGREFWAWANRYPLTERARGFLEGVASRQPS
jgi:predicted metal-dependent hydrolase